MISSGEDKVKLDQKWPPEDWPILNSYAQKEDEKSKQEERPHVNHTDADRHRLCHLQPP